MTKQETIIHLDKIADALENKRLKEAFDLLSFLLSLLQNWQLKEKLTDLENTYKMMLSYIAEGINDPERENICNNLVYSLYQVAESLAFELKSQNDPSLLYEKKRLFFYTVPESSAQLIRSMEDITGKIALTSLLDETEKSDDLIQLEKQQELIIQKIFHTVLLSDQWNAETKKEWTEVLNNPLNPTVLPALITTALTLNLLETFDEQKALLLFEAAESSNEEIKQRAITGIILFLRKYDKRLFLYSSINNRLQHLAENPIFIRQIRHTILQFIFCRETEKITRKIQEELFPQMMKISPKLMNKIKPDDFLIDTGNHDKNPEWQELLKESGLEDKLQEFSELQLEGADVMHSSFIHLKNYPFFSELCNWFIPFRLPAAFSNNNQMVNFAKTLSESTLICNSDKYSFYLSMDAMPENYRNMMMQQFSAETSSVQEMLKEETVNESKTISPITRQYIQDLYRFYKLHPRKNDFEDIFDYKPEFYSVPSIAQLIDDRENLFIIGEFYFNKNYMEEAADIFEKLLKEDSSNDVLYQKRGYCLQMTGKLEEALDSYLKAELFNANNLWIIKKLAYCYRILKQPEEALLYYRKAEQLNPDNLSVQLNIGHCYLELKEYESALKSYFKVEYLEENKQKAWRPIAWCSFLLGKYKQAMDYFDKILENKPNATDYLNAGHCLLVMGNTKEAVHRYRLSLKQPDNSLQKFIESFTADRPDLLSAGVKEKDIPFIIDLILYDL